MSWHKNNAVWYLSFLLNKIVNKRVSLSSIFSQCFVMKHWKMLAMKGRHTKCQLPWSQLQNTQRKACNCKHKWPQPNGPTAIKQAEIKQIWWWEPKARSEEHKWSQPLHCRWKTPKRYQSGRVSMQNRPTTDKKPVKPTWRAEDTNEHHGRLRLVHHSSTCMETARRSCKRVSWCICSIWSREIVPSRQLDHQNRVWRQGNWNGHQKQRKVDEQRWTYLSKGPEPTAQRADLKRASYRQNRWLEGANKCWGPWWGYHPSSWAEMAKRCCKWVSKAIQSIWLKQIAPTRRLAPRF